MQKLKLEGFQKGFPDLLVFLPNFLLVIEMKREKYGTVSKEQKKWLEVLEKFDHVKTAVCTGHKSAIAKTEEILSLPS